MSFLLMSPVSSVLSIATISKVVLSIVVVVSSLNLHSLKDFTKKSFS
jgi:hypothetical protein